MTERTRPSPTEGMAAGAAAPWQATKDRAPYRVSWLVRLSFLAAALVFLLADARASAQSAPETSAALPRALWCEAGFEESFGDRGRPFYTVEVDLDSRAARPSALFTHWMNHGLRPYFTTVVTFGGACGRIAARRRRSWCERLGGRVPADRARWARLPLRSQAAARSFRSCGGVPAVAPVSGGRPGRPLRARPQQE
jgi:hypothetical protein